MLRESLIPKRSPLLLLVLAVNLGSISAFQSNFGASRSILPKTSTTSLSVSEDKISDLDRPSTFLDNDEDDDDINVVFIDEDDDMDDEDDEEDGKLVKGAGRSRWENLKPSIKKRLIEKGQTKAIANKKKREPAAEKKRREFFYMHFSSIRLLMLFRIQEGLRVGSCLLHSLLF